MRIEFDLRIHAASVYLYSVGYGVVTLAENLSSLRLHIELNNVVAWRIWSYIRTEYGYDYYLSPSRALGTLRLPPQSTQARTQQP